jgi:DNA mismatch repair protein MutS2
VSLKNLDWESLLEQTRSFATCDLTREKILQMRAFEHQEQALEQIENVFQAQQIVLSGVRPFFESLDLCEVWIHRLKKQAVLQPLELKDVRHFCFEALALRDCLQNLPTDWSKEQLQLFMNTEEALSAIDQILTPGGEIRIDASQRLYQLHKEKENLARQVQNQLDRLVSAHSMANILQDKFVTTREGRWVLPLKVECSILCRV